MHVCMAKLPKDPRKTAVALEARRMEAVRLLEAGCPVARWLGDWA